MKKLITLIIAIALSFGFTGNIFAQAPSLALFPSIVEVSGIPGEKLSQVITVRNNSSFLVPVAIEVSNYSVDPKGIPNYDSDTLEWVHTDWIALEPTDTILSPGEDKEISIEVSIPEGAVVGSHVAAIIFKPVMPPEYFDAQSTHIIPYTGAVIGINVRSDKGISGVDFLKVQSFKYQIPEDNSEVLFNTTLHNNDVYYHKIEGDIIVTNLLDSIVVQEDVKGVTLFPESSREFENTYANRLPFGRYTATLDVSGDGQEATESVTFWVEPTVLEVIIMASISLGTIVMVALLVIAFIKRKNFVRAVKTLFKK